MKICSSILLFLILFPYSICAQEQQEGGGQSLDSLYREDQFYIGFNYNILTNMPKEVSRSGFSGGLHTGFIRDFPLNQQRNIGLGVGLGWSINTYGQTLFIGEEAHTGETIFINLEVLEIDYDRNRLSTQSVDVPLQFRWRTSTADSHKFWRVYTGLKLGYIYYFKSYFRQPGNTVVQTDVPEFDRFRVGATFAFGYNTFNFQVYYSLNPFFKDNANINGMPLEVNSLKVGLVFFIF